MNKPKLPTIPLWARMMEAEFIDCACECHNKSRGHERFKCCEKCDEDAEPAVLPTKEG